MSLYELYIDGTLCDLSTENDVTLLYQSPVFAELDAIQSNRSYNIALPITPANRMAVKFAEQPDIESDTPYVKLNAELYKDGIPLFLRGYAVVTDIADTINVTLTWGNVDNFQPLFDSNLRDLGPQLEDIGASHIDWNDNSTILEANATSDYPDVAFWGINFGMGLSKPQYIHPSVQVSTIISAIEQHNGITIEGKERLAYSPNLGPVIPLVSKIGDNLSGWAEEVLCQSDFPSHVNSFSANGDEGGYSIVRPLFVNRPDLYSKITGDYDCAGTQTDIVISNLSILGDWLTGPNGVELQIIGGNNYNNVLYSIPASSIDINRVHFDARAFTIDTQDVSSLQLVLTKRKAGGGSTTGTIRMKTYPRKEVHFPSIFPVSPNLPDMSQGDFILALMQMNGLFAYADKDNENTIKLISIDDIIENTKSRNIVDWSDKVVINDSLDVSRPESSSFTIEGLAQTNTLDYGNDDDVRSDTSGTIAVNSANIEKEADLVELPFSASESATTDGVTCAVAPIYEDDEKGGANYSECSPRILSGRGALMSGIIRCVGVFDPWMKFGGDTGLIKTKYASYQKVVNRPRIITTRALLTPVDLYGLDYTKPVYIGQFGHYYAIYSIETGDNDICECQLLKLTL